MQRMKTDEKDSKKALCQGQGQNRPFAKYGYMVIALIHWIVIFNIRWV